MAMTDIIGFAGALLILIAYIPQIRHIIKEHCAGGVSAGAWWLWFLASILLLIHAININDIVFTVLNIINLIAVSIVLILIKVYGNRICHSAEK